MDSNNLDNMDWDGNGQGSGGSNRRVEVKTPEVKMSAFSQEFFQYISPTTLEEVCQVAEIIAKDDIENSLSPIVGYPLSTDSKSSGSETDVEDRKCLEKLNSIVSKNTTTTNIPKTKSRKKRQRKRRRIMFEEEYNYEENEYSGVSRQDYSLCKRMKNKPLVSSAKPLEKTTKSNPNVSLSIGKELLTGAEITTRMKVLPTAGFSTVSGKYIPVSKEAVKKAQALWDDVDIVKEFSEEPDTSKILCNTFVNVPKEPERFPNVIPVEETCIHSVPSAGFSTNGGLPSEAVKKSESLWSDSLSEEDLQILFGDELINTKSEEKNTMKTELEIKDVMSLQTNPLSVGFSTASGKNISVSAEAAKKAQTLWEVTEMEEGARVSMKNNVPKASCHLKNITVNPGEITAAATSKEIKPSAGFSTAGGKNISVSFNALKRARELWNDTETEMGDLRKNAKENIGLSKCSVQSSSAGKSESGFATAAGKSIATSHKAVQEISIWGDDADDLECLQLESWAMNLKDAENNGLNLNEGLGTTKIKIEPDEINKEVMESVSALLADGENMLNEDDEELVSKNTSSNNLTNDLDNQRTQIRSISFDKKSIPLISVYIARVYPTIYKSIVLGKIVMLSQKHYEQVQRKKELEIFTAQEKIMAEVKAEVRQQYSNKQKSKRTVLGPFKMSSLENMTAEEILSIIEESDDVLSIESLLSEKMLSDVQEAKSIRDESMRSAIRSQYESRIKNVQVEQPAALTKILVVDTSPSNNDATNIKNCATVSIWRATELVVSSLKEGDTYEISNLNPFASNFKSMIQLNTTLKTQFQKTKLPTGIFQTINRKCFALADVVSPNFCPHFGEFDVVGLIISVRPVTGNSGQQVYISDEHKNFLAIRFWNCIIEQGLDDVLLCGNFVSICNLQWRSSSSKSKVMQAFVQETSIFKTNPLEPNLSNCLGELKKNIENPKVFASSSEMTLFSILDKRSAMKNSSFNFSFENDHRTTPQTPSSLNQRKFASKEMTVTPSEVTTEGSSLKRIKLLEAYGDPPPISPLPMVQSPRVSKTFANPMKK